MRVLNWVSINHNGTREEVYKIVTDSFESMKNENRFFWDEYIIGGGRWNTGVEGEILGKTATATKLPDNVTFDGYGKDHFNMIVGYGYNREHYDFALRDLIRARKMEVKNYLTQTNSIYTSIESDLNKIIDSDHSGITDDSMKSEIKRYTSILIADFLNNKWNQDSYYYDLRGYDSNINKLIERLMDESLNKNEWLVPVDLHIKNNA